MLSYAFRKKLRKWDEKHPNQLTIAGLFVFAAGLTTWAINKNAPTPENDRASKNTPTSVI